MTPWSLNVKLGPQCNYHKGRGGLVSIVSYSRPATSQHICLSWGSSSPCLGDVVQCWMLLVSCCSPAICIPSRLSVVCSVCSVAQHWVTIRSPPPPTINCYKGAGCWLAAVSRYLGAANILAATTPHHGSNPGECAAAGQLYPPIIRTNHDSE